MLAIHHRLIDRLKNVKAITAGTVAFGVGLVGAAAYVGSNLVYDNFSYEPADPKASGQVAGASTTAEIKAENGEADMPGSESSGTSLPVASQNSSSVGVSVAPATPLEGGRGGGEPIPTVTSPPVDESAPSPIPTDSTGGLLNTVDSTVEVIVEGLGL